MFFTGTVDNDFRGSAERIFCQTTELRFAPTSFDKDHGSNQHILQTFYVQMLVYCRYHKEAPILGVVSTPGR